jgi:hypothetical protein
VQPKVFWYRRSVWDRVSGAVRLDQEGFVMATKKLKQDEKITGGGDTSVGEFWSWAYSDILSNRNRSIFAEFVVGHALGIVETSRTEWDYVDHRYNGKTIEVKSAAYVQSWSQEKPSTISFDIAKKTPWDAETNTYGTEPARSADCYIFCLYAETDATKANVLNLDDWKFYVLSTRMINGEFKDQKRVALSRIVRLCDAVPYSQLNDAVDTCLRNA